MDAFVARQPILDRQKKIFAYELLFRSGTDNFYQSVDGESATAQVVANSFWVIGLDALTGGKMGFINFTEQSLKDQTPTLIPNDKIAVEILETVEPEEEVIAACRNLKEAGYLLALDDFVYAEKFQPLLELADIIKVDFLISSLPEISALLRHLKNRRVKLLAEKVETQEIFEWAYDRGFDYFQGYFFSKPVIVKGQDIPGNKVTFLLLMQEVNKPADQFDFEQIEAVVKRDVSLSYNLLKYINSVAFGLRHPVKSIKHALVYLGMDGIKRWINLFALRGLGADKPDTLIIISIIRARFCELMAGPAGFPGREFELFLLGMFSLIDAFLDKEISEILAELPLVADVRDALLTHQGRLWDLLTLVVAYEKGQWVIFSAAAKKMGLNEEVIKKTYFQAVAWADEIFEASAG